jgi:glycosyltransferase involved in cell wall biosynthesis
MISNQCPEWHVDIFGIGDEKQHLIDRIKYKKMQNKIFIHPATPKIYEEYSRSDFFVLSSRFEGLPLVLIEAMSSGLPCLSFRCKYGPEDIIEDGKNGILVEDGNIQQLAEKILWMCNHEKERNIMGIQARKTSEKYKKENIMPKWINLFNTLPQ